MADDTPATTPVETDTEVDTTNTVLTDTNSAPANASEESTVENTDGVTADDNSETATPPESYADFDLPEGIEMDSVALDSAKPLLKDLGLNQEQSQKLVDWYANQVQAGSQRQVEAFNQLTSEWLDQSKNDTEFGGDKFEESISVAQSAVNKFGTPELKQLLDDHGVGNHPEIIRFMVRVGELTREDVPGGNTSASTPEQSRVSLLYPSKSA